MATSIDYIEFVCEQIKVNFNIRYKKMFGEYMVYVNEKPILLVCDNTVYVKKYDELNSLIDKTQVGVPYEGAKEHFILDIENSELVNKVVTILEKLTSLPKKRK